jgi:hypothetical protein
MMAGAAKRVPEHVATQVRKVEPIGGDIVRLYFAVPRDGTWEDQCTALMSMTALPDALGLAITRLARSLRRVSC